VKIFASGNLDEWRVRELLAGDAPIDGFGIGTALDVSADAPYLECAYKLQEYAGIPRRKRSEGKETWPGRKQVFRIVERGTMVKDVIALETDDQPGEPLLQPVMRSGRRIALPESLSVLRARTMEGYARLSAPLRGLEKSDGYLVEIAPSLKRLAETCNETPETNQHRIP
jgi:nicotinate phosphoribosyltransferase